MDGIPVSDMKAVNSSAQNLFQCGHIQDIKVIFDKYMCVQAKCLPEMRKDHVYKLLLFLDLESSGIVGAECGCPAGKAHVLDANILGPCVLHSRNLVALDTFLSFLDVLTICSSGTGPGPGLRNWRLCL